VYNIASDVANDGAHVIVAVKPEVSPGCVITLQT
jgi:hypothetical protein